jgi:hypothetical protein
MALRVMQNYLAIDWISTEHIPEQQVYNVSMHAARSSSLRFPEPDRPAASFTGTRIEG